MEEVMNLLDRMNRQGAVWDFRTIPEEHYEKEISRFKEKYKTTKVLYPEEYNDKYNSYNIIFYLDKNSNGFIGLFNKDFYYERNKRDLL